MTDVWKLSLQAPRKMVLLALADNANDEGTDCWPSVGKLVEKCSMSERAVQGHLAALEDDGYIKRHERLGRSNKFTIHVDRIRLELLQKAKAHSDNPGDVDNSPPQILHPSSSNPYGIHTPADSAPPQSLHPTPAVSAPITTKEPSLKTTTTSSDALECCGGENISGQLHYPVCTQEESIAIGELLTKCPVEFRQKALDEIEGARQAGVIKTNLVPFARGILKAIHRGTFTVGHGPKVAAKRIRLENCNEHLKPSDMNLDPEILSKGEAFINRVGRNKF